VKQVQ